MQPLVTIIIANYNKASLISETITSVLQQTYSNWELLIVDDRSTDNSIEMINSMHDARIQLIQNTGNKGANFSRNAGIKAAKGEYIIFLDADDILLPHCLQSRVDNALQHAHGNLFIFTMGVFNKKIGDDQRLWLPTSAQPLADFFEHKLPWSILQPLWKKEFLQQLGGFDEAFQRLQDVELNTRAMLHADVKLYQFPGEADCLYRIDEQRKNFDPFQFLQRWANSASQYYAKFYEPAKQRGLQGRLLGTIYSAYLPMIYDLKHKKINASQLKTLEQGLLDKQRLQGLTAGKKILFKIAKRYNLLPVRVPGINWAIKKMLVS